MKSVADYWKIDLGIVVSLNFAYELRRVCDHHLQCIYVHKIIFCVIPVIHPIPLIEQQLPLMTWQK